MKGAVLFPDTDVLAVLCTCVAGDPVADAFAVCARENNCLLLIADGVNWGEQSRLAARAALYGAMEYINTRVFTCGRPPHSTHVSTPSFMGALHSLIAMFNMTMIHLCAFACA